MKHYLLALALAASSAIAQSPATGDYLFSKRAATGPNLSQWLAPNANDLLGWNGSGALASVPRSTFALASHNQAWSTITSTPTTLSGYGITDAQALDADLTDIAALAPARGSVMVRGASGWSVIAPGTSGQVLTTGGSGADAMWSTVAAAPLTLASGTLTSSSPALTATQTWNSVGTTFAAAVVDVTSTQSAASSSLLSLRLAGSALFDFRRTDSYWGLPAIWTSGSGFSLQNASGSLGISIGGATVTVAATGRDLQLSTTQNTVWIGTLAAANNFRTGLGVPANNVLEVKNGTAANIFRVYGTTTGNKYIQIEHNGTDAVITTTSGNLQIRGAPTSAAGLPSGTLWNDGGVAKFAP